MRLIILTSFLLFYLGFFYEGASKESFTPLSGTIYPFKEMNAEATLKPITMETVAPLPEQKAEEPQQQSSPSPRVHGTLPSPFQGEGKTLIMRHPLLEKETVGVRIDVPKSEESKPSSPQPISKRDELERQIKNSNSTYFFSDLNSIIKDVAVTLVSITPYNDKEILKFSVKNNQKEFFFISNITIQKHDKMILPELYYDPLVHPNHEMICLALLPKMTRALSSLTLLESSGKGRVFTLKFFVE
jgi:hypothetical protein